MGLASGGIAQFSAGAGRSMMFWWPNWADAATGGTTPSANVGGRLPAPYGATGGATVGGILQYQNYTIGAPGAINSVHSTAGSQCIMLKTQAAGDAYKVSWNEGFYGLEVEQLPAGMQPERFYRVFRHIVRCCFPVLPAPISLTGSDIGLMILPGNVAQMNQGANRPGIQFGPTDVGVWTLRSRKNFGAAYDFQQNFTNAQLGIPNYPQETWMTLEMRVISADNTKPAQFKMFCNEVQIGPTMNISAADGRIPGPAAAGGGALGYNPCIINQYTGVYAWYLKYMCLILAPDEQGNL